MDPGGAGQGTWPHVADPAGEGVRPRPGHNDGGAQGEVAAAASRASSGNLIFFYLSRKCMSSVRENTLDKQPLPYAKWPLPSVALGISFSEGIIVFAECSGHLENE